MSDKHKQLRGRSFKILRHVPVVVIFLLIVNSAALLQHLVILEILPSEIGPQMFVVPTVVGLIFGSLFSVVIALRRALKINVDALEIHRVEIEELNTSLEQRVEERGAQLAAKEIQLLQAQKMDALGQLSSSVAHDFNNLLTSILGWSDLLLRCQNHEESSRRMIDEIFKSGLRAAALTRRLLIFSRATQLRKQEPYAAHQSLTEMLPVLKQIAGEGLTFSLELNLGPDNLLGDKDRFELLMINLVANARDACSGGGTITVGTEQVDDEGRPTLLITVTDDGIGMSEELQARIFEPLFTTKAPGSGTGIGLSTSLNVIEECGGRIEVDSVLHQGTRFRIFLPLGTEMPKESKVQELPQRELSGTETVLVVDDDVAVRHLVSYILTQRGYTVVESSDGLDALAQHETQSIQLLLTDVVMPRLDGPSLAQALLEKQEDLKVVFMSGYAPGTFQHYTKGWSGFTKLTKPFDPAELLRSVREALDGLSARMGP